MISEAQHDAVSGELALEAPFDGAMLERVRQALVSLAPRWARSVMTGTEAGPRTPLDISTAGVLASALSSERERLRSRGIDPGGSSETLFGADPALQVQIASNDALMKRRGGAFANTVTVLVDGPTIEDGQASNWIESFFCRLSADLPVAYGYARTFSEFAARNKFPATARGRPHGIDISKSLPGLYWLNVFGPPYVALLGEKRLRSAPAWRVGRCGESVLVLLDEDPWRARTARYESRHRECVDHLGREFFFDRDNPTRTTHAPTLAQVPPYATPPARN